MGLRDRRTLRESRVASASPTQMSQHALGLSIDRENGELDLFFVEKWRCDINEQLSVAVWLIGCWSY